MGLRQATLSGELNQLAIVVQEEGVCDGSHVHGLKVSNTAGHRSEGSVRRVRPVAIRTKDCLGASPVESWTNHRPSLSVSNTAWKSIGSRPGA